MLRHLLIQEKLLEVNFSFCRNELEQNVTGVKYTEIFKKIKAF